MIRLQIQDLDHLRNVVRKLHGEHKYIAVDIETYNPNGNPLDMLDADIVGIAFGVKGMAWYVDFATLGPDLGQIWTIVSPLFFLSDHILISHNAQFDLYHIRQAINRFVSPGDPFPECRNWWDTLQMAALVDENLIGVKISLPASNGTEKTVGALSLKALSKIFLNRPQRLWDDDFMTWPIEEKVKYCCDDVLNCYDLAIMFTNVLKERGLFDYYVNHLSLQVFVAEHMERNGIHVDREALMAAQEKVTQEIETENNRIAYLVPYKYEYKYGLREPWTKAKFIQLAEAKQWVLPVSANGKYRVTKDILADLAKKYPNEFDWNSVREQIEVPFNVKSGAQLGEYLTSLGCRLPLTPTGQFATSEEILLEAQEAKPGLAIWEPLFKSKKLEKMRSTYIDGVLDVVWEDDTVHPQWNSSGTATGRYSCTSHAPANLKHKRGPALQTIPNPEHVEDESWEYNPRAWYIAREGHVFLVTDLKQAEVRMLAVMSEDQALMNSILSGQDIHKENAKKQYHLTESEWNTLTSAQQKFYRSSMKGVQFGITYGMGPKALGKRIGCTEDEAAEILKDFYSTFKGVNNWKRGEEERILRMGYSTTFLGRRRSPVLLQNPPRVTASPQETVRFQQQRLILKLWEQSYETAMAKAHLDPHEATNLEIQSRAIRQCINQEIQGSVGELINSAAWQLIHAGYIVVLQNHDELIIEVQDNPDVIAQAQEAVKSALEVTINGVPFLVDIAVGKSWAIGKE